MVERGPCREAARFAFEFARRKGLGVTSASKHTIQRITDGLFQEVVEEVRQLYPEVSHHVELFDALLAKIILKPQDFQLVLVLNEYGDFLSDMACGLVGSLGTGASGSYGFSEDGRIRVALFDPAGGTAPDIAGQNRCNPSAALLAFGMLLDHAEEQRLGHELRIAVLDAIGDGKRTQDLGGSLSTMEFTNVVVERLLERSPQS